MTETILAIGNDILTPSVAELLQKRLNYRLKEISSGEQAIRWLGSGAETPPDVALVDVQSLAEKALDVIRGVRASAPSMPLVAIVPYGDDISVRQVLQVGASDFVTKPSTVERLQHTLRIVLKLKHMSKYMEWLERRVAGHMDFSDIVGRHPALLEAVEVAQQASTSKINVWVEGAQGTEKELFARAIHGASMRASRPFVSINCEMLPAHMAESILFGGAQHGCPTQYLLGKIREADGGTLLLEEPQNLPAEAQARLFDFMENGTLSSADDPRQSKVDVRFICSVNTSVSRRAENMLDARLRQRLRSATLSLPSLSERKEDIPLIVEYYLAMYSSSQQRYIRGFTPEAMEWMVRQPWPGNVQQLSATILRAVMLCAEEWITLADMTSAADGGVQGLSVVSGRNPLLDEQGRMKTLRSVQEEAIRFALQYSGGCMTRAAKSLGIGRSTLYRKLGEYRINSYISRANQTTRPMMKVSSMERS